MTTIQVRNVGTYGFDVTPLTGLGLSLADADATRSQVDDALNLADAIRQALASARSAGTSAFKPTDGELVLPAGLSAQSRDQLFQNVIGRAYSGGPIDLEDWSRAVDALEHWAGAAASMLPPGAGGGSRNVGGTWYVNGLPWSLSELFTVNRVNTLAEIDRMTADSLNVIAANNRAAKALTGLMQNLFKKYADNEWDRIQPDGNGSPYMPFQRISRTWVDAVGTVDQDAAGLSAADPTRKPWTEGSECFLASDGAPAIDYPMPFSQLLAYADKYIGPDSMIRKMAEGGTTGGWNAEPDKGLLKDDFRTMIDEVETIISAFGSDNQVAQLRNETLFNSRSNLLEGLSSFLKGQQTTRSTLARNT